MNMSPKINEIHWKSITEDIVLTDRHKRLIQGENNWLSGVVMNGIQHLIRCQFPRIEGLIDVSLIKAGLFVPIDVGQPFVQIVLINDNHWLTISNIGVESEPEPKVRVFDSWYEGHYSALVRSQLASFVDSKRVEVLIEPVIRQTSDGQCGLLAISFALMLCRGLDPINLKRLEPILFRKYLVDSIEAQSLGAFLFETEANLVAPKEERKVNNIACRAYRAAKLIVNRFSS